MPIYNITNLASQENPFKFRYAAFGRAKEYRAIGDHTRMRVKGFSINFDTESEAKEFLSQMKGLNDDKDEPIFARLHAQVDSIVDEAKSAARIAAADRQTASNGNLANRREFTTGFTVNIECAMDVGLEQKIRRSNLAQLIERQEARKQLSTAKTVVATAVNAATFGVPVVGYVAGYTGLALARAEKALGWLPGVGFALRNSSRLLLDVGAGILQNGKSWYPTTATNQSQARKLEGLSDNVGNRSENWNGLNFLTDSITFGIGTLLKCPAVVTNFIADVLNRLANSPFLKNRKANQSGLAFWLKKTVAGNAAKALATPFRVPEIAASWLLDSAKKSMPDWHHGVDKGFKHARIGEDAELKATPPIAAIAVGPEPSAIKILGLKPGLVFNREYYPDSRFDGVFGGKPKYLAELARHEINGITYKVLGSYDNPPEIFYKHSGSISKSPPSEVAGELRAKLEKEAEGLQTEYAGLGKDLSPISVNGFSALQANAAVIEKDIKAALKAALDAALAREVVDKKGGAAAEKVNANALPDSFNVDTAKNYSFKVGSQVLTYESGTFAFSENGQKLNTQSREFFNFLGNLSQGKAKLKLYGDDLPSTSVKSPTVHKLSSKGVPGKAVQF